MWVLICTSDDDDAGHTPANGPNRSPLKPLSRHPVVLWRVVGSRCVDVEEDYALFRVGGDCVPAHVAAADLACEEFQVTELEKCLFDFDIRVTS